MLLSSWLSSSGPLTGVYKVVAIQSAAHVAQGTQEAHFGKQYRGTTYYQCILIHVSQKGKCIAIVSPFTPESLFIIPACNTQFACHAWHNPMKMKPALVPIFQESLWKNKFGDYWSIIVDSPAYSYSSLLLGFL